MVLNILIAVGGIALLFYLGNQLKKPLTDSVNGINETGGDVSNTIFPPEKEQERRDNQGFVLNTFQYLFGRNFGTKNQGSTNSMNQMPMPTTPPAIIPMPAVNTTLTPNDLNIYIANTKGRSRFGK